jgi:hypothetical protein
MELQIRPEPTDEERRAILAALAGDAPPEPDAYGSRWRRAALEEGVVDDASAEPDDSAAPS